MEISKNRTADQCISFAQMNIILNSRIFWRKLATWERTYLFSRYAGIGIADDVFGHMFTILSEFSTMLRLVFGAEFAEEYYQMLVEHVTTLRDTIDAQFANDTEAINRSLELQYQNAENRASYLSRINPYWDFTIWRNMIEAYIDFTVAEANTFTSSNYERNIETFDRFLVHTDTMGDYFALGLYNFITNPPAGLNRPLSLLRMSEQCITYDQMNTIYRLRLFWFEMATWTRAFMISRFSGVGFSNEAYDRLRRVPVEYGILLKNYFDSNQVEEIMRNIYRHIDLIDDLVTAYQAGNIGEINRATSQLYQNVDEGAVSLNRMNPLLSQDEWRAILYGLISNTIGSVVSFLTREYNRNISIYNRSLDQAELIGDNFSRSLFNYVSR
jgi:hypothetical protein